MDIPDKEGRTPLSLSVEQQQKECTKYLILFSRNVNERERQQMMKRILLCRVLVEAKLHQALRSSSKEQNNDAPRAFFYDQTTTHTSFIEEKDPLWESYHSDDESDLIQKDEDKVCEKERRSKISLSLHILISFKNHVV